MDKGPSGPVPPTSIQARLIESGMLVEVPAGSLG